MLQMPSWVEESYSCTLADIHAETNVQNVQICVFAKTLQVSMGVKVYKVQACYKHKP